MRYCPKVKRAKESKSISGLRSWSQKWKPERGQPARTFYSIYRLCCVFTEHTLVYWSKVQKTTLIIMPAKVVVHAGTHMYINQLRRAACQQLSAISVPVFFPPHLWNCSFCKFCLILRILLAHGVPPACCQCQGLFLLLVLALSVLKFNYAFLLAYFK